MQNWSSCASSNLIGAGYGRTTASVNTGQFHFKLSFISDKDKAHVVCFFHALAPIYANYIEMKLRPHEHCDRVFSRDHGKLGPGKVVPLDCKREVNFLLS
jgi:hypothetical protein